MKAGLSHLAEKRPQEKISLWKHSKYQRSSSSEDDGAVRSREHKECEERSQKFHHWEERRILGTGASTTRKDSWNSSLN